MLKTFKIFTNTNFLYDWLDKIKAGIRIHIYWQWIIQCTINLSKQYGNSHVHCTTKTPILAWLSEGNMNIFYGLILVIVIFSGKQNIIFNYELNRIAF